MRCQKCQNPMLLLFVSWVCDHCEGKAKAVEAPPENSTPSPPPLPLPTPSGPLPLYEAYILLSQQQKAPVSGTIFFGKRAWPTRAQCEAHNQLCGGSYIVRRIWTTNPERKEEFAVDCLVTRAEAENVKGVVPARLSYFAE